MSRKKNKKQRRHSPSTSTGSSSNYTPLKAKKQARESTISLSSTEDDSIAAKVPSTSTAMEVDAPTVTINSFRSYYLTVMEYLNEEHWLSTEIVAPLLSLQDKHCLCSFLQVEDINDDPGRPYVESVFDDIVQMHIAANFYVSRQSYYQAYNLQLLIISIFSKEIVAKEKDSNWYLPLMPVFCSDLRLLAKKAEFEDKRDLEPYMEDVANVIMGLYRVCVADSRPDLRATKKVAIVPLTVELFRVYFDMNKMTLLKPLIRSVENLNNAFIRLLSLSDLVAYNYFLGKKAIFDGDMATANRALQHAFDYCPERFKTSRRNILIYWLPVKMFLGYIPNRAILKEFDLSAFDPIVNGIDHGDCKEFRHAIAQNSRFFIKSGILLMLEKLTNLAHLALFKRLHSIVNKDGGTRVKLDAFFHLLRYVGEDVEDVDEAMNIIAGLIAAGRIKGYISHQHKLVLLSKAPFSDPSA